MKLARNFAFLFTFLASACCHDEAACRFNDSTAQDGLLAGRSSIDANASIGFPAAQAAFRNNCIQCHAAFGAYSESQWISAGYVVVGQPNQSLIFQKTRGSGTGGPENMPPGSTITAAEIAAIRTWISKLQASGSGPVPVGSAADQRLSAALLVFSKPSAVSGKSCNTCHTVQTTSAFYPGQPVPAFGNFSRDAEFVTSQLVTPGLIANSWMYRSLRSHGGDIASMPQVDSISNADAATLENWISQIGN